MTVASDGDWTGAASNVVVDGAVASAVDVNPTKIPTAAHTVTIASTAAVTPLDDTAPRARRARRTAITSSAPDVTAARSGFSIRLPRHGFAESGAARRMAISRVLMRSFAVAQLGLTPVATSTGRVRVAHQGRRR